MTPLMPPLSYIIVKVSSLSIAPMRFSMLLKSTPATLPVSAPVMCHVQSESGPAIVSLPASPLIDKSNPGSRASTVIISLPGPLLTVSEPAGASKIVSTNVPFVLSMVIIPLSAMPSSLRVNSSETTVGMLMLIATVVGGLLPEEIRVMVSILEYDAMTAPSSLISPESEPV